MHLSRSFLVEQKSDRRLGGSHHFLVAMSEMCIVRPLQVQYESYMAVGSKTMDVEQFIIRHVREKDRIIPYLSDLSTELFVSLN